ncbi:biotin/lipoyl-containing protein [Prevotella koreensis]|uniref:biotin/lipoyl-containing protein n=1 Tax=Prevotella koreensis TaxID=2490854 RepID=UPI0028EE1197|nr:biotin/lipoyl-containing protein [Prevotella koreensis]
MSKYQYKVNGIEYNVEIQDIENNIAYVSVNGKQFEIEMPETIKTHSKPNKEVTQKESKPATVTRKQTPEPKQESKPASKGMKVTAPLPGTITEVKVAVGQAVKEGDTVVVLEAMKMQNNIEAETNGTITEIHVSNGDTVMEGKPLVTIG